MQSADAFVLGPGAVLFYTVARTGMGLWLSYHGRQEAGPGSPSLALQALSDGILVLGALLYANPELRPEAPRVLMATLLVYAIAWEAYGGLARVVVDDPDTNDQLDTTSTMDDFLNLLWVFSWIFMTLMLIALSSMVVMSRAELTDSQKLAPIVGVGLPILLGPLIGGWLGRRNAEGWRARDSLVGVVAGGALAFSIWAWL